MSRGSECSSVVEHRRAAEGSGVVPAHSPKPVKEVVGSNPTIRAALGEFEGMPERQGKPARTRRDRRHTALRVSDRRSHGSALLHRDHDLPPHRIGNEDQQMRPARGLKKFKLSPKYPHLRSDGLTKRHNGGTRATTKESRDGPEDHDPVPDDRRTDPGPDVLHGT